MKKRRAVDILRSHIDESSANSVPVKSTYMEIALQHECPAYTKDLQEKLRNSIDDLKFNKRLDTVFYKKENIPNYEEVGALTTHMGDRPSANYQDFMKIADAMPSSVKSRFFTASLFDALPRDSDTAVDSEEFLKFVQRSVDVETVYVELASYAATFLESVPVPSASFRSSSGSVLAFSESGQQGACEPYITEPELERFVFDSVNHVPLLVEADMHESFLPFYVFTAVRKLLFFLDPQRTRRVSIRKLAHSQEMDEFLWLQRLDQYRDTYDPASFSQEVAGNWFSAQNAIRLYDMYVALDKDGNGMLSQDELLNFQGDSSRRCSVQLTPLVISRIFQENITYEPAEMDFKTFLDLVLVVENRDHLESLRYLWRVVDVNKDGILSPSTVEIFYRDIRAMLLKAGYDSAPLLRDVGDEVMDMLGIAPLPDCGASFKQLTESGQASTVLSMLVDVHKFFAYDNRENPPVEDEEDGGVVDAPAEGTDKPKINIPSSDSEDDDPYDFY
mmetsp:Transcript_3322/g.5196  ORF Transcript_3322/g.5196 Transcript_3322/m.5196 type:complete len:503 (+) Transcript_3322:45-1553(+)